MSVHTRWIPSIKIKVPVPPLGTDISPRILALGTAGRSKSSAMELRLGRQRLSFPARIRFSLGMTNVHGPSRRQRNIRKHGAAEPCFASRHPELRMLNSVFNNPLPSGFTPQRTLLISTSADEVEIVGIRYLVHIDRECRNMYMVRGELVVPAKAARVSGKAESCYARRNLHLSRRSSACVGFKQKSLDAFFRKRQPVQHVRESFRMHQTMLDSDPEVLIT